MEEPVFPPNIQEEKVYVFPNPAREYFKVVFEQELSKPAQVYLHDGLGLQVFTKNMKRGSREFLFSLGGVQNGMYFYEIKRMNKVIKSGKLTVMD